jgi:voltage-gated potassium channel Kch
LIWAFAYGLVILHAPQAFHADELTVQHGPLTPTLIYFSCATLTTVGYGDITPIHPIARSLAMLEAFVGQLFPAILIARLVAMELHIGSRDDVWIPILFTPMPSDLSVLGAYYFHSN